jgi:hypothetical protein
MAVSDAMLAEQAHAMLVDAGYDPVLRAADPCPARHLRRTTPSGLQRPHPRRTGREREPMTRQQPLKTPAGAWYSTITFPDEHTERSVLLYGQDGSVPESSTRYPTRLAGIGQWRPVGIGQFEAFFEKFLFPADSQAPTGWARVEYRAVFDETGDEYTAEATGIFLTMERIVTGSVPTIVTARRIPWTQR